MWAMAGITRITKHRVSTKPFPLTIESIFSFPFLCWQFWSIPEHWSERWSERWYVLYVLDVFRNSWVQYSELSANVCNASQLEY